MSRFIEPQRFLLEEIDAIEQAVATRLRRYPHLLPNSDTSSQSQRPSKETLLQKHELRFFFDKYKKQCSLFLENYENRKDIFSNELKSLNDPSRDFQQFDNLLKFVNSRHEVGDTDEIEPAEDTIRLYSMYSSALPDDLKWVKRGKNKRQMVKRKQILSVAASHINIDSLFNPKEEYGKFIDLSELFPLYQSLQSQETQSANQITYLEYLSLFLKFPYDNVDNHSSIYNDYLNKLLAYLSNFYARAYPYENISELLNRISDSFDPSANDGKPNENGEVYCNACDKVFTKDSVYKGHLDGKKHKKNISKQKPINPARLSEHKISQLALKLSPITEATISNHERKAALTEREKMLEDLSTKENDLEYTTADESSDDEANNSGSDFDSDDEDTKSLPLGIDGRPVPHWLYKLQGLNRTYDCEICGNATYKGPVLFNKHFSTPKHQHGLKCLGVDETCLPIFKNITKISEAMELWKRLKREKRAQTTDLENAVEVEDDEGNVMSEKDYLELKRQGLL
ncbi:hypothetical protein HYPBUDRAFT_155309 [Hyphopichia burtonii NRRL Y-1933]|uniref:C2H2-type domain-containing protein n=1 Tax=Hyphopichia burtonii NRRL Y-1933 TaxID=984485 RepID=A0A1E4RT04_9ASCO|nr:hypothetical protein HYPBUDRAFT_155309 [Hyphopichia burtonii NRRL Y-1933]ODV70403.1 hypothetical protein HYPBUDRAFT_155309 [Hyphopichia burtonii NRRL Y-1933]